MRPETSLKEEICLEKKLKHSRKAIEEFANKLDGLEVNDREREKIVAQTWQIENVLQSLLASSGCFRHETACSAALCGASSVNGDYNVATMLQKSEKKKLQQL